MLRIYQLNYDPKKRDAGKVYEYMMQNARKDAQNL
jgi:hypothetical protein